MNLRANGIDPETLAEDDAMDVLVILGRTGRAVSYAEWLKFQPKDRVEADQEKRMLSKQLGSFLDVFV